MSMPLQASAVSRESGLHTAASRSASKMIWSSMADADLNVGVQMLRRAAGGEPAAIKEAEAYLSRLFATKPFDPLVRAYAGSALALKALTCEQPLDRLHHVSKGLALIDQALERLDTIPATAMRRQLAVRLELRYVAASTFLALPAMFNRSARGQALLQAVLDSHQLALAPAAFRAEVQNRLTGGAAPTAARRTEAKGSGLSALTRADVTAAGIRARLRSAR